MLRKRGKKMTVAEWIKNQERMVRVIISELREDLGGTSCVDG